MPKSVYFVGVIGATAVVCLLQIIVLLTLGVVLYGLDVPSSPGKWLTFAWVWVLGLVASCLLGIVVGSWLKSSKAAPAVTNLPFVGLQFISGVFVPFDDIPNGLRTVASLFPLKWLAEGMRSVFLPDSFAPFEPDGSWQHGPMALVLLAWCVIGFLACVRLFRWTTR